MAQNAASYIVDLIGLRGIMPQDLTPEQVHALHELVRREAEYGALRAAQISSNTWGDGLLQPFNSDLGAFTNIETGYGELDLDWFTDMQSVGYVGAYSAVWGYLGGKPTSILARSVTGMEI